MKEQHRKMGIIGMGPRGGYALERLIIQLVQQDNLTNLKLCLFEETGEFGNGQVYSLNQHPANWINLTERVLDLERRAQVATNKITIPSFPSYKEWMDKDVLKISDDTPDTYPPRSKIGEYLSQRFQSLIKPLLLAEVVSVFTERVEAVNWLENKRLEISTNKRRHEHFDEVLLTIGHQPTKMTKETLDWKRFASNNDNLQFYTSPYPITAYLNDEKLTNDSSIAIRGFGLAMIDVARAIALKFGEFIVTNEKTKKCVYKTDASITDVLIPFSLDGLPPVPKPLNAKVDNWFKPDKASIENFQRKIENTHTQKQAKSAMFLIEAFIPIASKIFMNLPSNNNHEQIALEYIENIIKQWLINQSYKHPLLVSNDNSTERIMSDYVQMAIGEKPISLDFCIGQVWRHCQPTIYQSLSFNECTNEVFAEIIELDESTKRYSFGPPVESIQQLLALAATGFLNLDLANNPNIELTKDGWQLSTKKNTITADVMIDSVLDSPKINKVQSKLVKQLLSKNIMQPIHDDFGIETDENGYLMSDDIDRKIPIALLGRLAKGTIIGVDAILECFGSRPDLWAKQAAHRHKEWLHQLKH